MNTAENIYHTRHEPVDEEFPNAPAGWYCATGQKIAEDMNVLPGADHWRVVQALQDYYIRHETESIHMRELIDALDEAFHVNGGIKYLYKLFPDGPLAQGCRMAGLQPPAGATDKGFGSSV